MICDDQNSKGHEKKANYILSFLEDKYKLLKFSSRKIDPPVLFIWWMPQLNRKEKEIWVIEWKVLCSLKSSDEQFSYDNNQSMEMDQGDTQNDRVTSVYWKQSLPIKSPKADKW